MRTKTIINTLKYWEDISDCVCDNTTPIGGCLKCDMRECIEQLEEIAPYLEDVKYVFQVGMDGKQNNTCVEEL